MADRRWLTHITGTYAELISVYFFVIAEIYLLWETVPGLLDPKTRVAYGLFLVPFHVLFGLLARAVWRLHKVVREMDERTRARTLELHTARLEQNRVDAERIVSDALAPTWHEADECPGPPEGVEGDSWWDVTCGALWLQREDGAWVQTPPLR